MMGGRKRWEKIRYGGILVEGTPLTVMMVIILEAFMEMVMAMLNYWSKEELSSRTKWSKIFHGILEVFLWKQTKRLSFLHRETFWFCEKGKSSGTKVIKGWYKNDKYYDKKDNDDHDIYVIMIIRLWRWRWRGSYLWQRCQLGSFYCSVMPL